MTCSTTRLITLFAPRTALAPIVAPAAAPAAAATCVLRRRVAAAFFAPFERPAEEERPFDDDFLAEERLAVEREPPDFFPPLRPAIERFTDVVAFLLPPARFFDDFLLLFEDFLLLDREDDFLEDLLFDADFLLEEPLREPPLPDDFFEEPFFDAAMGMSPFQSVGWGAVT